MLKNEANMINISLLVFILKRNWIGLIPDCLELTLLPSQSRLLWAFRVFKIQTHIKRPFQIETNDIFLNCVMFHDVCSKAFPISPQYYRKGTLLNSGILGNKDKMTAPMEQHGKCLFWRQLLNRLSSFHVVFTDNNHKKRTSFCSDQGD